MSDFVLTFFFYPLCLVRAVMLEELDLSDILSNQGDDGKQELEKTHSPRIEVATATSVPAVPSFHGMQTGHMSSDYAMSDASTQALHPTSSLSSSSFLSVSFLSAPPTCELSSSLQTQIERLKVECLSSCLTVCLHRLDLSTLRKAHQGMLETRAKVASPLSLELKLSQNTRNLQSVPCLVDNEIAEQSLGSEMHAGGLPAFSLAPITAPSKMPVAKENNGLCTSRKVYVSGFNSSRWTKKGMTEQKRKQRQDVIRTKPGDCSSSDLLLSGADSCSQVMLHFLY